MQVSYSIANTKKDPKDKDPFLDPSHNAFILVDDGTEKKFGGEIEFRAKIEALMADHYKIPVILIVVGGGPNTLDCITKSIENNIPCLFIDVLFIFDL